MNVAARRAHLVAGIVTTLCIASSFCATLLMEGFGLEDAVARPKSLIVMPVLFVLVPAIAIAGGSGFFLPRSRRARLVEAKKKRMPFIAANGLLVLGPCAIVLAPLGCRGVVRQDTFHAIRALELVAGATNLVLVGMNMRDGLRMSGRLRSDPSHRPAVR